MAVTQDDYARPWPAGRTGLHRGARQPRARGSRRHPPHDGRVPMTPGPDKLAADPAPDFGGRSRWIDLDGPVHYLDFGGPAHGPVIVCVHGLSGSAVNWSAIAPLLTGRCRVLAPDLAGHGLTRSVGRGTDVAANRALLHRFIEAVPTGPVILMGNSMGGMISLLEAGADPLIVAGLILVDPALPFVPARPDLLVATMFVLGAAPGLGRAMLGHVRRLPPERAVASIMSLCCTDASRVPSDVVAQHVEIARLRGSFSDAGRDISSAMRSVIATAGVGGGQAYRRGIRSITCPVLLLHGERDRLVPVSAARAAARANPSWSLVVLPGVGHVPQLEAPRECAAAITQWLGSAGRRAAESATPGPRRRSSEKPVRRRPGRRWHLPGRGGSH
jgi:pimeloyl-ACP methyl ester carboxylesterase